MTQGRLAWFGVASACVFGILGFASLNGIAVGAWTDDVVYLSSGIELVAGRGYRVAMFPGTPLLGKYPPLFPLVLGAAAQVLPALPQGLFWFKAFVLALALPGVFLFALWLRDGTQVQAIALSLRSMLLAFVAVQGLMLLVSVEIMSEPMFGSLLMLGAWLVDRQDERAQSPRVLALAVIIGVLLFYTRTIGVVFLFALTVHALIHGRPRRAFAAALCGLALWPWFWWSGQFVPRHEPMLSVLSYYLSYDWHSVSVREYLGAYGSPAFGGRVWHFASVNGMSLVKALGAVLVPTDSYTGVSVALAPPHAAAWLVLAAVLIGLTAELRRKGFVAILICAYLALAWLWPWLNKLRFVAVVAPFVGYFAVRGVSLVRGRWPTWLASGAMALCIVSNATFWFSQSFLPGDLATWIAASPAGAARADEALQRSVAWLGQHVPHDAVLISDFAAPFFYVHTGRPVVPFQMVEKTPGQHLAAMLSDSTAAVEPEAVRELARRVEAVTGPRTFYEIHACEAACPERAADGSVPGWNADFRGDPGSQSAILIRRLAR